MRSRPINNRITAKLLLVTLIPLLNACDIGSLIASRQQQNDDLIARQRAHHIGVQAYLYGYPLVDMHKQMHNETHLVSTDQQVFAPVNRFYRFPGLVTPDNSGNLRAPNNDTLYFSGWYDVSEQPVIIHVPDTGGRYYTIAVTNQYAEVSHIGRRTTGTDEGFFALVGPNWTGRLPDNVRVWPVETPRGWLLGRMLVDGPEDLDAAQALVDAIWLAELDEFSPQQRPAMANTLRSDPIDPIGQLDFFATMNRVIKTLPARSGEAALMAQFDAIGVGPNARFDSDTLTAAQREGLIAAIEDGEAIVEASTQRTIDSVNGWMISKQIGIYGYDYFQRAAVVRGGYGNLPEESLYPARLFDHNGELLTGKHRYRLHFPAGQQPPVNGFWSIAVYDMRSKQLVANEIDRYSIGDRTRGLQVADDGSITLYLQHERPAGNATSNWLPTPAGHFFAVMRLYEPKAAVLDGDYSIPPIELND